jgi:HlyD family secretion protein
MGVSRRKRKWWSIPLIIVIIAVIGVAAFFGYQYVSAQNQTGLPANLTTVKVSLGSLAATVGASGNVYANQTASLTWQTAGKVGTLNVKQGDKVKANDVLALLDPTSLTNNNVILAQQDLINAQQALSDLKESTISKATAQQALVQAQKALSDAQTSRDLLNYSRGQNGNADAAWAEYYIAVDQYNRALDRFNKLANLDVTDTSRANAQASLVSAQQNVQNKQAVVNWYTSGPTANEIAQADANLAVAQAKMADAQRTWDQVKNGPSASELASAQAKIDAAQAVVNQSRLAAPFNGTITVLNSKLGDLVNSGTVAARIDDLSTMFVDLSISEVDIAKVKINQKATLTFDAIASKTYNGFIHDIDLAGSVSSGTVNYNVTIQLIDTDSQIMPGMTASASIVLDSVENVLTVPSRGVRVANNQSYVIVLRNGALERIQVRLGLSSDTNVQVISNQLQDGDVVVTNALSQLTTSSGSLIGGVRIPGVTGGLGGAGGFTGGAGGFPAGGGGFPAGGGDFGGNGGTGGRTNP